ncbi:MAG: hypothetical protein Q9227_003440 [Pyrenula ochraceoflavens]
MALPKEELTKLVIMALGQQDVACIVAGFPSNIAALQFEWAWQQPHRSRHTAVIAVKASRTKKLRASEEYEKSPKLSRVLTEKLTALHKLLRATYFSKWPLQVRFFEQQVYEEWASSAHRFESPINSSIRIIRQFNDHTKRLQNIDSGSQILAPNTTEQERSLSDLDPTYKSFRAIFDKAGFVLHEHEDVDCSICSRQLQVGKDLIVICQNSECNGTAHLDCLSDKFRAESNDRNAVIPATGKCPSCQTALNWIDLMKELTVRVRSPSVIDKILNRSRDAKSKKAQENANETDDEPDPSESDVTVASLANVGANLGEEYGKVASPSILGLKHTKPREQTQSDSGRWRCKVQVEIQDSDDD